MLRFGRIALIVVATIVLSTLATNALDMTGNLGGSLIGTALAPLLPEPSKCPAGMSFVSTALGGFCVDTFEASAGDGCAHRDPGNSAESQLNLASSSCMPVSEKGKKPWRFISQTQAQAACTAAGKRLPSAEEWYRAALGTPDTSSGDDSQVLNEQDCNVARNRAEGIAETGSGDRCVSHLGVYDMVGNAWEWVDETIAEGVWHERPVPENGYVSEADTSGMPTKIDPRTKMVEYGDSRFWSDASIIAGAMRGGYFGSRDDAGVFAVHAASPPSFTGEAVGFRCVSAVQ